ncbi:MAG: SEL1-like repeat protein, partial [Proteobacteria bacterium]|nr:SEL1-like repeat protein [Pseudomonadota bacterium]
GSEALRQTLSKRLGFTGRECVRVQQPGATYENGQGTLQDYVEAHKWYNLAASQAFVDDLRNRATENRDGIAAKMTPAQIAEAQKLAKQWDKAHPR